MRIKLVVPQHPQTSPSPIRRTNISDGALIALAGYCPNLHAVSISGIASVKDRGVINLAKSCPKLVMLDCFGTGITNAALDAIATHCAEMQYLNLGLCLRLTTAGLLDSLPRCRLQRVPRASVVGLVFLMGAF
jgi:hypothetical protein